MRVKNFHARLSFVPVARDILRIASCVCGEENTLSCPNMSNCRAAVRRKLAQPRARELVDAALGSRDPASITKVRLSNKSYSVEAAKVIGEALEKMTNVTEVIVLRGMVTNHSPFLSSVVFAPPYSFFVIVGGRKRDENFSSS